MEAKLTLRAAVELTVEQLADLIRQLTDKDRSRLLDLMSSDNDSMSKQELVARIAEGLREVKRYKAGEVSFKSARAFLDGL